MPAAGSPEPAGPGTGFVGKPPEVEELVDEHIHRPLARRLVRLFLPTPLSPNQVTLLSGLAGIAAGAALVLGVRHPGWRLAAGLLLFTAVVLDCADGQLARARGVSSTYGGILDGVVDYAVGLAVGLGASWFLQAYYGEWGWWLLGIAGIASSAVQSALFDHTKSRYIARVGGGYAERNEDLSALRRERAAAWRERRLGDAALLWVYCHYTATQYAMLDVPPAAEPARYRARYAGRMRAWTFQGIGTHFALAYLMAALSFWWPPALAAYFVITTTVLNLYLGILLLLEQREPA